MTANDAIGFERLEALLAEDTPRTNDELRRAAVLSQLRDASLSAPEALRSRVLAAVPSRQTAHVRRPSRRLVFAVIPATFALALTAAVVHGLTTGSARQVSVPPIPIVVHGGAPSAKQFATPGASAGSGGSATGAPVLPASPLQSAQSTLAPTGGTNRLQHTDASLQVRVADVTHLSSATRSATRIATSLGGYAQSVDYTTPQHGNGTAYIELRVPAQNVQRALERLAGLGTLVSQQVSVKDLQHSLQVESDQIAQLRRRVAALHAALVNPALPDAQRVLLQIKLAESRRALAQRLNARTGTVTAGTTARISLVLSTAHSAVTPVHQRGRTGRMLHSAVGFLGLEGMIALYALIVISPFALIGGLAWALARMRRRRDEDRLLTT
jgi:Domain of unknown function (DUF4349)